LYENDKLNGECTYYDEVGKLLAKGYYKNDKKHGAWYYFEKNKVILKEEYRYGQLESETTYDAEGKE
jgi:antitoxin component YwqK of YwqJK toxin-antitoxin module